MKCAREITRTHVVRLSALFTRSGRVNGAMLRLHRTRSMSSHQVASKLVYNFSSNVAPLTRPQFRSICHVPQVLRIAISGRAMREGNASVVSSQSIRKSRSEEPEFLFALSKKRSGQYV